MSARSQALSHDRRPLSLRSAAVVFAMLVVALFASGPIRAQFERQGEIARLEEKAAQIEAENAAIRTDLTRLRDPAVLEQIARECLGMVRPGETAVIRAGDAADC